MGVGSGIALVSTTNWNFCYNEHIRYLNFRGQVINMSNLLEQELHTYETNRETLLGSAEGKFVLIFKDEILGVFDTEFDAIRQGYKQLGNVPFLVKQVVQIESPIGFTSNLLAV